MCAVVEGVLVASAVHNIANDMGVRRGEEMGRGAKGSVHRHTHRHTQTHRHTHTHRHTDTVSSYCIMSRTVENGEILGDGDLRVKLSLHQHLKGPTDY